MALRLLMVLLAVSAAGMAAQKGFFGPVTTHLKAGDIAPDVVFKGTLSAGSLSPWSQVNLTGQLTVITFRPDTSHNLQSASRWNVLAEQFADKSVQFVWITGEKESSVLPWLKQHPLKGWVFYDPDGATAQAYGLELPAAVIIGNDRRVIGFDRILVPTEGTLNAALESRITTLPPQPVAAAFKEFTESRMVLLDAEPPRIPRIDEYKPDFPSSYTLHVSPSKTEAIGNFGGDDYWSLQGVDLRGLISQLYDVNAIRVDLPASLDDGRRYDVSLVLPERESREEMKDRFRRGIEDYFHFTAAREELFLDVYVVSAPNGKHPEAESPDSGQGFTRFSSGSVGMDSAVSGGLDELFRGPKAVGIGNVRSISTVGTIDNFCQILESTLDRPVVDETNLPGRYMFEVKATDGDKNDFLERLREKLNLTIAPAQRRVEIVVLRPR